jgi:hypothetical protein
VVVVGIFCEVSAEIINIEEQMSNYAIPCGGGIEYLHRSPASRDGKRTQCPGIYLGHPVPGGYKYGDLVLQVGGVSRIVTIKYGLESRGTQTRKGLRWLGPAAIVNYRPVPSSEKALQNNKPATI